MLNSRPDKNEKYQNGLYIPNNKEKIIKLNDDGGLYYRSSIEYKLMTYLDYNDNVRVWNTELIKIPYLKNTFNNYIKEMETSEHIYYPDFYYEFKKPNGEISKVVAEVKPYSSTIKPVLPKKQTAASLRNFEYAIKEYSKNCDKWRYCIEWCRIKGFEFVIITEETFKRMKI